MLSGNLKIPPSKSLANRAIICAGLADGESVIKNVDYSDDIIAATNAMKSLKSGEKIINCNESGTLFRLLTPIVPYFGDVKLIGSERLMARNDPKSSQHISGKLLAAPLCGEDVLIKLDEPLQSRGYVDLTINMMHRAGIEVENRDYMEFFVPGGQSYQPFEYEIEADFSQAAFFIVANEIGNNVTLTNLPKNSFQGDRVILEIVRERPNVIDPSQFPDLVPILAVWATFQEAETHIVNAARLREKESDRLASITSELNKMGAKITELPDGLIIKGLGKDAVLNAAEVDSWNDHRIAMSLAIAATRTNGKVRINGCECVKKSYPKFWDDYAALGGLDYVINLW